jgi:hypothetical protein
MTHFILFYFILLRAEPANSAFPSLAAQSESDATVDALTESANIEKILADMQNLRLRRDKQVDQHWAHMVDIQSDFINFNELVPELALEVCFPANSLLFFVLLLVFFLLPLPIDFLQLIFSNHQLVPVRA